MPGGTLTLTMHPQVIGRRHRMLMLEHLIAFYRSHAGVRFAARADAVGNSNADSWEAEWIPNPPP